MKWIFKGIIAFIIIRGIFWIMPPIIDPMFNNIFEKYISRPDILNIEKSVVYLLALAVFAYWYLKQVNRYDEKFKNTSIIKIFAFGFVISQVVALFLVISSAIIPNYNQMYGNSGESTFSILWICSTLLLPPVVEEMVFRGIILDSFIKGKMNYKVAIVIQAVLFGIFHMNIIQGIYTAFLGIIFGYIAIKYGNILNVMILHLVFNFFGNYGVIMTSNLLGETGALVIMVISVPCFILMMKYMGKNNRLKINYKI